MDICNKCKHKDNLLDDEPCRGCLTGVNTDGTVEASGFEPEEVVVKRCKFCRYKDLEAADDPCWSCLDHSEFNPTKNEDEVYACDECKYLETMFNTEPCHSCSCGSHFSRAEENDIPDPKEENDVVNHPSHYCREDAMECIDEMELIFDRFEVMTFCKLNAWKYRYRAADKNGEEDMKKSDWYLRKYKEIIAKGKSQ